MKYRIALSGSGLGLILLGVVPAAGAAGALDFENPDTRINYSLGYQIGGDFKRQQLTMDPDAIVQGIQDALSDATPQLTPEAMRATLVELKRKVVAEQESRRNSRMLRLRDEGSAFLEENAKQDGVVTAESGLQYRIVAPGEGKTPGPTDQVTVNYRGRKIDGKEFDSSYKRGEPATFRLDAVIKGWTEGLQLIGEGGRIELFIPPNLAYGRRGPLAHQTLLFDVELISVDDTPAEPADTTPTEGDAGETDGKS